MNKYFIAFISILLGSIAQLFLKKGSNILNEINFNSILKIFTNIYLLLGLLFYGLSALLWINVLSKMKLSIAYPLVSFGYILTTVFSYAFLNEKIYINQVIGIIFIMIGIFEIAK